MLGLHVICNNATDMLPLEKYEDLRVRPEGKAAMLQQWRDLSFLHFSVDPAEIEALLPSELTVDTFPDVHGVERAWVGLVPFRMQGVTPLHVPPIPGCHAFPETNVRTYVHREGKKPGVWFFSLEAANAFACRVARKLYSLPYYHARMRVDHEGANLNYSSIRRRGGFGHEIAAAVGPKVEPRPGTLEFFLIERYLLYSMRGGKLYTGQVYHTPCPIHELKIESMAESLIESNGITPRPFEHALFSPSVDVEVFPLREI